MTWNRILALAALVAGIVALVLGLVHEDHAALLFAGAGVTAAGAALLL